MRYLYERRSNRRNVPDAHITSMMIPHKACRSALVALALGLMLAFIVRPAAASERIAVLGVEGPGVDARVRAAVGRALVAAVEPGSGHAVLDVTDVPAQETLALIGCSTITGACLDELAELLGADALLYGTAAVVQSRYTVSLTHYVAGEGVRFAQTLPFSSNPEDGELTTTVASMLVGLGVLDIDASQAATATFDGADAGVVPVRVAAVTPGVHTVEIRFADGRVSTRDVVVEPARYAALYVTPDGRGRHGDRPPAPAARRVTGWTLVATGVGAGAAGAVFAIRSDETQRAYDDAITQRRSHELAEQGQQQTRTANALFVTGAVLSTTGVVVLATGRGGDAARVGIGPGSDGTAVRVRLAF